MRTSGKASDSGKGMALYRISRPCYDKMHRCPGWAGGGALYARVRRCDDGYISYYTTTYGGDQVKRLWKWRFNRCPKCRVIVLPYMTRWADWRWWRWEVTRWASTARYRREDRRG